MIQMLDLLLYCCHNLYSRTSCTDDRHSLVGEIVAFFVLGRMHQLTLEVVQAGDVGPFPVVQHTTSVDEELGAVFKDLICFQIPDTAAPEPGFAVPLKLLYAVT